MLVSAAWARVDNCSSNLAAIETWTTRQVMGTNYPKIIHPQKLLLCIRVQTGNLEQLGLVFTHKFLNVVLGCVLDVCLLLANTWQDDRLWWYAVFQHQAHFSLGKQKKKWVQESLKPRIKTNPQKATNMLYNWKKKVSLNLRSNSLSDCNCSKSAFITGWSSVPWVATIIKFDCGTLKILPCWHNWSPDPRRPSPQWQQGYCCTWLGNRAAAVARFSASTHAVASERRGPPPQMQSYPPETHVKRSVRGADYPGLWQIRNQDHIICVTCFAVAQFEKAIIELTRVCSQMCPSMTSSRVTPPSRSSIV